MPPGAYNEYTTCPGAGLITFSKEMIFAFIFPPTSFNPTKGGVVLAALAHYFMVAVLAWTACEVRIKITFDRLIMSPFRVFMFTSMWLMFYQDRDIVI